MTTALPATLEWWRPAGSTDAGSGAKVAEARSGRLAFGALVAFTFFLVVAPQEFIPALAVARPARVAALAAILAFAIDRWRARGPARPWSPQNVVAGLLLLWSIAILPLSYWPSGSLGMLFGLFIKALTAFWLIGKVVNRLDRMRTLMWMLSVFSIPLAVTGIHNYLTGNYLPAWCGCAGPHTGTATVDRINGYGDGLAGNPNDLALTLDIILPLTVALLLSARRWAARLLALGILLLDAATVVITFSRGGFIALAVIFGFCLIWLIQRRSYVLSGALVLATLIAVPILPARYTDRLATMLSIDSDLTGSAQDRWRDTIAATEFVMDHPLVGAGLGMDYLALNEVRGPTWRSVHNTYLNYGVDLGLPGMVLFILLLVLSVRQTLKVERWARAREDADLATVAHGVRLALYGFAAGGFFYPVGYHFYFYYLAGLAVALGTIVQGQTTGAAA